MASDLNDLIEIPRETLEIELKEWLDLSDPSCGPTSPVTSLLGPIMGAAISIFGFKDDLRREQKRPHRLQSALPHRIDVHITLFQHGIRPYGGLDRRVLAVVLCEDVGGAVTFPVDQVVQILARCTL